MVYELVNDGSVQAGQGGSVTLDSQATVFDPSSGFFYFYPGQPWSNNADGTITATQGGTLNLGGQWTNDGTITATQGAALSLSGQWTNDGMITAPGASLYVNDTLPWTNDGTITATQGGTVALYGQWTNDGTITATGATLILGGPWTNDGTITVDAASTVSLGDKGSGASYIWKNSGTLAIAPGASVNLGDYFTTDEFESGFQKLGVHLDLSGYTVSLIGTLDNNPADNPITGGALTLDASTGPLYLYNSGEIDGGTIMGSEPLFANYGTLNGVIVDAAVNVTYFLSLQGNWSTTVNGAISAPDYTQINLSGTWTNNGTIAATGSGLYLSGTWTNNGTITATGSELDLYDTWTNNGTLTADAASTVSLGDYSSAVSGPGDIWKNSGTLAIAPGATLYLGDYFTTDEFESGFQSLGVHLNLFQYTVNLIGIIDDSPADNSITGGTLALNQSTGPLHLVAGIIDQGTITTSGSDDLIANSGTLDGVTLDGTLNMSGQFGYVQVNVIGGLTLNTDLYVSGDYASLNFLDGSTVAVGSLVTSATIHLNGYYTSLNNDSYPSQAVTMGRGITISGGNSYSSVYGPIDNLGTIEQNGAGGMGVYGLVNDGSIQASNGGAMGVYGLVNDGSIQASNGGAVYIAGPWCNNAGGTIMAAQGATLSLDGNWTNQGSITVDSSSTLSLGGGWQNSGTLAVAAGATLYLSGYFTTDAFESGFQQLGANLNLSQYTVNLTGTIDNSAADNPITGGTLALNQSTGPLYLAGGVIDQGTITTRGSDDLVATNSYFSGVGTLSGVTLDATLDMSGPNTVGTLSGVTLDATLDMSGPNASLAVINGLTLNATLDISGPNASVTVINGLALNADLNLSGAAPACNSTTALASAPWPASAPST